MAFELGERPRVHALLVRSMPSPELVMVSVRSSPPASGSVDADGGRVEAERRRPRSASIAAGAVSTGGSFTSGGASSSSSIVRSIGGRVDALVGGDVGVGVVAVVVHLDDDRADLVVEVGVLGGGELEGVEDGVELDQVAGRDAVGVGRAARRRDGHGQVVGPGIGIVDADGRRVEAGRRRPRSRCRSRAR